jgi:hypothetical protein
MIPIPGEFEGLTDNASSLKWPPHPFPSYMGQTFQTLSRFWVIIQEINTMYNLTDDTPLDKRVSLSFAESKYQSLLAWADSLLPSMIHGEHSPSHVLFFQ